MIEKLFTYTNFMSIKNTLLNITPLSYSALDIESPLQSDDSPDSDSPSRNVYLVTIMALGSASRASL